MNRDPRNLHNQVHLASWATPRSEDSECAGAHRGMPDGLHSQSQLASWPTPNTMDTMEREEMRPSREATGRTVGYLSEAVVSYAAPWPTPNTPTGGPNTKSTEKHTGGMDLEGTATLANWATPTSRDHKDSGENLQNSTVRKDGKIRLDVLGRQAQLTASGPTPSGSGAKTESIGQLNPAHSRWLMGLPPEWCACAVTATACVRRRPMPS
jgi:hypothetical protein